MAEFGTTRINQINFYGIRADLTYSEIESMNAKNPAEFKYVAGIYYGEHKTSDDESNFYSNVSIYAIGAKSFNTIVSDGWSYEFTTSDSIFNTSKNVSNRLLINKCFNGKHIEYADESLNIEGIINAIRGFEAIPKRSSENNENLKAENLELKKKVKELRSAIRAAKKTLSSL